MTDDKKIRPPGPLPPKAASTPSVSPVRRLSTSRITVPLDKRVRVQVLLAVLDTFGGVQGRRSEGSEGEGGAQPSRRVWMTGPVKGGTLSLEERFPYLEAA